MRKNINNNNLYIFNKYVKNSYKSIPFNERVNNIGNIKYLPPIIKEWKNSIYVFNKNNLKNLPAYNIDINTLITSYFDLYFNNEFLTNKLKTSSNKLRRLSMNKIFVSKAEIKHTNNKAIVTVYTYNKEKLVLLRKIKMLKKSFLTKIFLLNKENRFYDMSNKLFNKMYNRTILTILNKELILFRKLKLKLSLNKYKFEEVFLYKLSKFISRFYNKKIELNIINLKSIVLNSDLFTKILTLKLKNRKANVIKMMSIILNKAVLPKINRITEKSNMTKSINYNLVENKFKSLNLSSIIKESNLDIILNDLYYSVILNKNKYDNIYETIFNSIKYKNMGGIRLEVKGRLTKRYRADRAIFKVR